MSFLDGVGAVLAKITDWIPGRVERRRNEIEKVQREMDICHDAVKYRKLAKRLCQLETQARNG